jgi:serine/threonine protein kinase
VSRCALVFIGLYTILIVKRTPGQEVAIKRHNHQGRQGVEEFLTEILILGKLDHPNLVKLLGCCADCDQNQMLLVYEYMPLGSLFNHIHGILTNYNTCPFLPFIFLRSWCVIRIRSWFMQILISSLLTGVQE